MGTVVGRVCWWNRCAFRHSVLLRQLPSGLLPARRLKPDLLDEPTWLFERIHLQASERSKVRGSVPCESLPRGGGCPRREYRRKDPQIRAGRRAVAKEGEDRLTASSVCPHTAAGRPQFFRPPGACAQQAGRVAKKGEDRLVGASVCSRGGQAIPIFLTPRVLRASGRKHTQVCFWGACSLMQREGSIVERHTDCSSVCPHAAARRPKSFRPPGVCAQQAGSTRQCLFGAHVLWMQKRRTESCG